MSNAILEHVNLTVSDPLATAGLLVKLFDWKIRWQGQSMENGFTVHVGSDSSYLALYAAGKPKHPQESSYQHIGGMNHIGILVDDLEATERKILEAGFKTNSHADYEPGKRFYFDDNDGVEFEIISYN